MKKSLGAKTLPMPAVVWVIGSYDSAGKPNVMTAAWAGICCSDPPCVAVSLRKARYTYENILARQAFTVNIASVEHVQAVDYFGIASGKKEDKLARTGLTAVPSETVDAPYVQEFPLVMECKLRQTVEIGSHIQFIGEVVDIKIEESALDPNGDPDVERLGLFVFTDGHYRELGKSVGKAFSIGRSV